MSDIKFREIKKGTIKTINKSVVGTQKIKDKLVQAKNKVKETYQEETSESGTEYAINTISKTTSSVPNNIYRFNKYGKRNFYKIMQNIYKVNKKMKAGTKATMQAIKTSDRTLKTTKRSVKTAKQTIKTAKKTVKITEKTAKATIKAIQVSTKIAIVIIKTIIVAIQTLISALIAGGWISVIIIVVICVIALICSTVYGIFFSNENVGDKTMSSVIRETNIEFINKISEIQDNTEYDEFKINTNKAEWRDILSIYAVIINSGNEQTEVITLDDNKINKLKEIFWQMNIINSRIEEIEKDIEVTDENGNIQIEKKKIKILYIDTTSKTLQEMIELYNLNMQQQIQLTELQKTEYNSIWSYVISGSSSNNNDIVEVAIAQVGNIRWAKILVLVWI